MRAVSRAYLVEAVDQEHPEAVKLDPAQSVPRLAALDFEVVRPAQVLGRSLEAV